MLPLASRWPFGSRPRRSISQIAKWPPERLAYLVVDDAGVDADVAQGPRVEPGAFAALDAAAAPLAQRREDRAQDQAPARPRRLDRAIGNGGRWLGPGRSPRGHTLRRNLVAKFRRDGWLMALLQKCRHASPPSLRR